MAPIDADQIRELFVQEAEVRLGHLATLMLELERSGSDPTLVDSVFREMHTLKGSAAVAGLDEVSGIAHELEDLVDGVRVGRRPVDPDLIDTLLAGTDRLGAAIARRDQPAADTDPSAEDPVPGTAWPEPAGADRAAHVPPPPATGPPAVADRAEAPVPGPQRPVHAPAADDGVGGVVMVPMERLDELVRMVGESASAHLRVGRMLQERFRVDPASLPEYNKLSRSLNDLQDKAMRSRMVPVATITDQLHRAVRDLARAQGKDVRWEVRGADTELDRGVLHQLSDSLLHLVRNAVDHGIESAERRREAGKPAQGTVRLHAMQLGSEVTIAVTDDGPGIDLARVRAEAARYGVDADGMDDDALLPLIFRPGLSTASFVTDVSGRGVGLDVVRASVEAARGRVEVRSQPGVGTEFRLVVPITLAVLRCLLVEAGGQRFALPFHRVVVSVADDPAGRVSAEGRQAIWVDRQPVPVSALADTLGVGAGGAPEGPIVVVADTSRRHAFQVDRLVGQRDVVVKGLSRLLPNLPVVAGASVEPDGSVLVVVDPPGLIQRARQSTRVTATNAAPRVRPDAPRPRVLVVDDALTVRELQRSILERAGFEVAVAADGSNALAELAEQPYDLVLTDIEMPTMDGFALTEAIRSHPTLANIPVLILSSRSSDADRQRGLDAGADGYIVKSGFDEGSLLTAVNRLLGGRHEAP